MSQDTFPEEVSPYALLITKKALSVNMGWANSGKYVERESSSNMTKAAYKTIKISWKYQVDPWRIAERMSEVFQSAGVKFTTTYVSEFVEDAAKMLASRPIPYVNEVPVIKSDIFNIMNDFEKMYGNPEKLKNCASIFSREFPPDIIYWFFMKIGDTRRADFFFYPAIWHSRVNPSRYAALAMVSANIKTEIKNVRIE